MSGGVVAAPSSMLSEWWRRLRNPAFWMPVTDTFAVLTALSLAWSTSLVGIFSACWIGLLVVVQNIVTSLFNSHIFDFHEGWMYVLGVGVAGGMMMKQRTSRTGGPQ